MRARCVIGLHLAATDVVRGGKTLGKMKNPTAPPKAVPSAPLKTKIAMPRQNLLTGHSPVLGGQWSSVVFSQRVRSAARPSDSAIPPTQAGQPIRSNI